MTGDPMHRPSTFIRRFLTDETAAGVLEAVIVLPLLVWTYLAMFVYWDAFSTRNTVQKATYTVSDMISREMNPMSQAYLNGLLRVLDYLVDENQTITLRVSSVTWNETRARNEILWSYAPQGLMPVLTTALIQGDAFRNRIPQMADSDTAIIVETAIGYDPAFDVGLNSFNIQEFIVTRPRFVPEICFGSIC